MSAAEQQQEPVEPEVPLEEPETPQEPPTEPEEPESPEQPETPEEPAEPPTEPQGQSLEAQQKAIDKAQKRAETYVKAAVDILGPLAADLGPCPRCADFLPGFIFPLSLKPVEHDQLVAVKLSLGEGVEPAYEQDRHANECPECHGWGKVSTGSHVPKFDVLRCEHCDGRGFVGQRAARMPHRDTPPLAVVPDEDEQPAEPKPAVDPWGRMKGDPLYGVMPGFEPDV